MTHTPIKNCFKNFLIVTALIVFFIIVFYLCHVGLFSPIVWQSAFFFVALTVCELLIKFFLPEYTYILDDECFKITKTLGKKITTVCDIDLSKIVALYSREEYKKQEEYKPRNCYNYNGNVFESSCYVLVFKYSDCCECVFFEPDKKMVEEINRILLSA